jgi:hypothetical protein
VSTLERLRQELGSEDFTRYMRGLRRYCAREGALARLPGHHIGMCTRLLAEEAA